MKQKHDAGYRLLESDEIILEGDEYWSESFQCWKPTSYKKKDSRTPASFGGIYRRKVGMIQEIKGLNGETVAMIYTSDNVIPVVLQETMIWRTLMPWENVMKGDEFQYLNWPADKTWRLANGGSRVRDFDGRVGFRRRTLCHNAYRFLDGDEWIVGGDEFCAVDEWVQIAVKKGNPTPNGIEKIVRRRLPVTLPSESTTPAATITEKPFGRRLCLS